MHEGMYQVTFQGAQGNGVAILVFQAGYVFGTDGGVQYDGIYTPHATDSNVIDFSLKLTVPPGVWLVQGKPAQNVTYSFDLSGSINIRGVTPLNLKTPYGPIKASVQFLRDLPADLAA